MTEKWTILTTTKPFKEGRRWYSSKVISHNFEGTEAEIKSQVEWLEEMKIYKKIEYSKNER
jgi:hypothetical protein